MQHVSLIALVTLFERAHSTKELAAKHALGAQDSRHKQTGKLTNQLIDRAEDSLDKMADKLANHLVDQTHQRAFEAFSPHFTELDDTALRKPSHQAMPAHMSHTPPLAGLAFSSRNSFSQPYTSPGYYVSSWASCRPHFSVKATPDSQMVLNTSQTHAQTLGSRTSATQVATSGANPSRSMKLIQGLQSADFQHPMDKQASQALKLFAPLEWGVRQAISELIEDAVFLENIASSVLVGPKQLPDLHSMLLESCRLLGLSQVPDLYIKQSPSPNAYTLAVQGRRPFVVVTTALLDLLDPIETQAVIAHELGHLKCEHSLFIAMANLILSPLANVLPIGSAALQTSLLQWQRAAELSCDRAALMVVQDVRAVQGVIMKLCGGGRSYAQRMDVDAFVRQAVAYDEVVADSRIGWMMKQSQQREATHPLPIMRAREIERFATSEQYAKLLDRGRPTIFKYR